ncbi:MAG: DUF1080 domain-containing protein [Chitinophagaceae bacterium]
MTGIDNIITIMQKLLTVSFLFTIAFTHAQKQSVFKKDFSKPEATEVWNPKPAIITPGIGTAPPSDAIVLFDGKNLDNWETIDGSAPKWLVENGVMTIKQGTVDLRTKQKFGDCQLHIEFKIPNDLKSLGVNTNAGNSGVFLQERYEVQIFDSYNNHTPLYANGQTGSIYKQVIPMANASSKNGEWNIFDIYYTAPTFLDNGTLDKAAFITVIQNGVLTLNHFKIQGNSTYIGIPKYELHDKASVRLQSHGSAVSFRNIWLRDISATAP